MTNQNQNRLDTLTPIHKGLRRSLFEAAIQLARTDFGSAEESAAADEALARCFGFLREHAEHEDEHVLPEVARLHPALADELRADHPRLERLAIAVEELGPRIARLHGAARASLGAELVRRFHALVAEQLRHMDREEREVNATLWAAYGDDQIAALSRRITGRIPPARMREWGALLELALSRPEREAIAERRAA